MTAEIAIMNKEAVALAADSAVTLTGQKIFTSANKIFALSKYQPVGVMIYGNASFMGTPWETIIKIYRNNLGKNSFDNLEEYADHFIKFLIQEKRFFPETEQEKYVERNIYYCFVDISKEIEKEIENSLAKKANLTKKQIKDITSEIIEKHCNEWKNADFFPSMSQDCIKNIMRKYESIIDKCRDMIFQSLNRKSQNQLKEIAASLFVKFLHSYTNLSGLVIAGFGTKDIFPSIRAFSIGGIADNKLKYQKNEKANADIDYNNEATIIPFAQSEMVHSFMTGVDPDYEMEIERYIFQILETYPSVIIDKIQNLNTNEKEELKNTFIQISRETFKQCIKELKDHRMTNYANRIMNVVASLPKNELADMAESLVNLTSFKRKVSMEAETVGGPIDVAVISKGDGFIWIKRKHYFNGELNPHFFANYYKEIENGEDR